MNDFLKCLGSGLCVYVAMAACGGGGVSSPVRDVGAQGGEGAGSVAIGSRLVPYVSVGDDGTRQQVPGLFFDSDLQTACRVVERAVIDDQGNLTSGSECQPVSGDRSAFIYRIDDLGRFTDAACSVRLVVAQNRDDAYIGAQPPAEDVRRIAIGVEDADSATEFFELGDAVPDGAPLYANITSGCSETDSGGFGQFSVGARIDIAPVNFTLER